MKEKLFTEIDGVTKARSLRSKTNKKGHIRTSKQHKALMEKAVDVLGINDRNGQQVLREHEE